MGLSRTTSRVATLLFYPTTRFCPRLEPCAREALFLFGRRGSQFHLQKSKDTVFPGQAFALAPWDRELSNSCFAAVFVTVVAH
jgi:hypothetical protein